MTHFSALSFIDPLLKISHIHFLDSLRHTYLYDPMVRGPWVDLKADSTLHKQGAKTYFTPNHLCTPHPQFMENLHHLQQLHQNLGF